MKRNFLHDFEAVSLLYRRLLAPARQAGGVTQGELDILLFLANNPEHDTASDIVSMRRLAKSNVSVGVRRLEEKGFLLRQTDARDRRLEHLQLAPAAGQAVEAGRQGQAAFEATLTAGFSPEERAELGRLLACIRSNISRALSDGPEDGEGAEAP